MAGAVIAFAALAATLLPMIASSRKDDVREIRVVARDMTFYVDGKLEPNPTIVVRAGEQIRVRVLNDDPGMRHDFSVKAWQVATRMLEDKGEEDLVTFRVPKERGEIVYTCTPHSRMMTGKLRIE